MNRIYISGPITGVGVDANKQAFKDMVLKIHDMGIGEPVSPRAHRMPPWFSLPENEDQVWTYMMKRALKDLLDCDSMVLLDGWEGSKGCLVELEVCKLLEIPVFDEHFKIIHLVGDDRGILFDLAAPELRTNNDSNSEQAVPKKSGNRKSVSKRKTRRRSC